MNAGDRVRLKVPENATLNGTLAIVAEPTEWGAHCWAPAAATGRFRAWRDEMELIGEALTPTVATTISEPTPAELEQQAEDWRTWANGQNDRKADANGAEAGLKRRKEAVMKRQEARESGYTGNACDICGSVRVKQTGPCVTCEACGANSGCS